MAPDIPAPRESRPGTLRTAVHAAVPDELAGELALVGPANRIRDRLQAWKESPVKTILAGRRDPVALRALARAAL